MPIVLTAAITTVRHVVLPDIEYLTDSTIESLDSVLW